MCVFILHIAICPQSDICFGKPSLCPIELAKPPVIPLLQHADDVTL